jgi:hypothetical protein
MKMTMGYRCMVTGKCYCRNDSRLFGYGSPPSSPEAQRRFPGQGRFPMASEMVALEEIDEEQHSRIPPEMIFEREPASEQTEQPQTEEDNA